LLPFFRHANIFHLDIVQAEWFGCEQCNTFFPSENVLKLHEKQVTRRQGDQIGRIFLVEGVLCSIDVVGSGSFLFYFYFLLHVTIGITYKVEIF
jgi:hypothetical protein